MRIYLEDDGFAFRLGHLVENRLHDLQEFVVRQRGRIVLLEIVDEVVQQKVGACPENSNSALSFTYSSRHTKMTAESHLQAHNPKYTLWINAQSSI